MNESRPVPLLEATHQLPRLKRAGFIGTFGFVLASTSSYVAFRGHESLALYLFLLGVLLMCIALWVAFRRVRCPNCGDRWLPTAMKTQQPDTWFNWLLSIDSCPRCGVHSSSLKS